MHGVLADERLGTLPQGNQEPLMVKDKVERPPLNTVIALCMPRQMFVRSVQCHAEYSAALTRRACAVASLRRVLYVRAPTHLRAVQRNQSDTSSDQSTDGERRLISKLQQTFPKATDIHVIDISGLYR